MLTSSLERVHHCGKVAHRAAQCGSVGETHGHGATGASRSGGGGSGSNAEATEHQNSEKCSWTSECKGKGEGTGTHRRGSSHPRNWNSLESGKNLTKLKVGDWIGQKTLRFKGDTEHETRADECPVDRQCRERERERERLESAQNCRSGSLQLVELLGE